MAHICIHMHMHSCLYNTATATVLSLILQVGLFRLFGFNHCTTVDKNYGVIVTPIKLDSCIVFSSTVTPAAYVKTLQSLL